MYHSWWHHGAKHDWIARQPCLEIGPRG